MTLNHRVVDGIFQMQDLTQTELIRLELLVGSGHYEVSLYPEGYEQTRKLVGALREYSEGIVRGVSGYKVVVWIVPYEASTTPTHFMSWLTQTTQLAIENEIIWRPT